MKQLIFILLLVQVISCQRAKYTGESVSTKSAPTGSIVIKSIGYGPTIAAAKKNAMENAFKNIFTKGIPNSNQSMPLLSGDAEQVLKQNSTYFSKFFDKGMQEYIVSQNAGGFDALSRSGNISVEYVINLASLRTRLENDGIIRKFGL